MGSVGSDYTHTHTHLIITAEVTKLGSWGNTKRVTGRGRYEVNTELRHEILKNKVSSKTSPELNLT